MIKPVLAMGTYFYCSVALAMAMVNFCIEHVMCKEEGEFRLVLPAV